MHKTSFLLKLVCIFFLSAGSLFLAEDCSAQKTKKPAVSGTFYPASAKILAQTVRQYLDWAQIKRKNRRILALIAPHAGYSYSGSIAAYAYKAVKDRNYKTVIVISPSHFASFEGISVYPQGAWQTPLGNVDVDTELASALIKQHPRISFYPPAFNEREHSLEVQIPFLQMVLDDFKLLPVTMGNFSYRDCQILSRALLEISKNRKDILIVASTDMSHRHPYKEACEIDQQTIEKIRNLDARALYNKLAAGECELCGAPAVLTAMLYARKKGAMDAEIFKYANSGDITGVKENVVGYVSAAIYSSEEEVMNKEEDTVLNAEQKKRLLAIARKTLNEYITRGKKPDFQENDELLLKHLGAFVTLHKQGKLRGCIGNIVGRQPLYLTVRDMAIEAAVNDWRFGPVIAGELPEIEIEISVLSEPQKVENADEVKLGVHGVIVKKDSRSGVFLPQVAEETGWSREEFLSNLCAHKAGLNPSAWKDKDTELYTFTAQVFAEQ